MPRFYATIECSIWDDPDFCNLSAGAQRTYLMLVTQHDISACGTLPLTLRRWAKTCSEKHLPKWLDELVEARFVLFDEDSEELLVRTFAKYDGGYKHPTRRKAVASTARSVRSPLLKEAVAVELAKLGMDPTPTPDPPDRDKSPTPEAVDSYGSVVTEVSTDHTPETLNLERGTAPTEVAAEPPSMFCSEHPEGTTDSCGPCGGARRRYQAWHSTRLENEIAAKAARNKARDECDLCNDKGIREHPQTGQPLGRCDHKAAS